MENEITQSGSNEIRFTTPDGLLFPLSVEIENIATGKTEGVRFTISGKGPAGNENKTGVYHLDKKEHDSYLNLYQQLSVDFGLRLPQNRKKAPTASVRIPYREVLSSNLSPGMLYGYGDPAALRVRTAEGNGVDWYYLVSTSNDAPDSFPIIRSKDLQNWEFVGYVFPRGQKPRWAADGEMISDYWAPEMHFVENEYRVYFVARKEQTLELCIGMARAPHPAGPFVADPAPILTGNKIDPHIFIEDENTTYLLWKEDNNEGWPLLLNDLLYRHSEMVNELFGKEEDRATLSFILTIWPWVRTLPPMERFQMIQVEIEAVIERYAEVYEHLQNLADLAFAHVREDIRSVLTFMRTPVYAQQLSRDGSTLVGERIKLIENDLAWEAHLVEGVWLTKYNNTYYLFYAGNDFSTDKYGIGVAISDSPVGPFRKMSSPFLQSTSDWWAPGHPSVVPGLDGRPLMFLHAFFPHRAGYKQFRALLSIPLKFEEGRVLIG